MRAFYTVSALLTALQVAAQSDKDKVCQTYGKENYDENGWYYCYIEPTNQKTSGAYINKREISNPSVGGLLVRDAAEMEALLGKRQSSNEQGLCCSKTAQCGITAEGISGCYLESNGKYQLADGEDGVLGQWKERFVKMKNAGTRNNMPMSALLAGVAAVGAAVVML